MFEALRTFIADISSSAKGGRDLDDGDVRLATAALLVHVANVDGKSDAPEKVRLRQVIEDRFGLDAAATRRLIHQAEAHDREAVDFFHFTNVLKRGLDEDGRQKIIEMMWDVVFADGVVSEFEENVVWRIAELLGVSNRDRILLRQKAADDPHLQAAPDAALDGPWSTTATNAARPPGEASDPMQPVPSTRSTDT